MVDQVANFKKVTVSTGYNNTATSIVLATGQGAELPDPSGNNYNLVWWDSTNYNDPADDPNVEIVRVTAKSTDTLTVTRNQEGSGASNKNNADATYKMILAPTAKTITDMEQIIHADIEHNLNAFDLGERILALMTSPVFLNVMCDDPGAGTLYDISGNDHDGTYTGTWVTAQRLKQGRTWMLNPNGSDNYITMGDHNDFSFGDGSNDSAITWFGMIEVSNKTTARTLLSKWDSTTGTVLQEYLLQLLDTEKIRVYITDNSAAVKCYRTTDNALSIGKHTVVITYDGAGGATAANTIKIYIDGGLIASTAINDGSYVAMENLTVPLLIGAKKSAAGAIDGFIEDDVGCLGIDANEWTAEKAHRFHQLCLANYSEDGISL